MKWLTIPQIKRRSKTAKGALKVSYEHWCQLYDATAKELRAEYKETDGDIVDADYCGLCNHKSISGIRCDDCVFTDYCPAGLYYPAFEKVDNWIDGRSDWYSWKRACKAVRDKLGELIEQRN